MSAVRRVFHRPLSWLATRTAEGEWITGLDTLGRGIIYRRRPRRFADRDRLNSFIAALEVGGPPMDSSIFAVHHFGGEYIGTRHNRGELDRAAALDEQARSGRKLRNRLGLKVQEINQRDGSEIERFIVEAWDITGPEARGPVTITILGRSTLLEAEWIAQLLDDHSEPLTAREQRRGVAVIPIDDAREAERKREDRYLQVRSALVGGVVGGVLGFAGAVVGGLVTGA